MGLVVQELNNLKGFFENRGYTIIDEIDLNVTKKTKLNCIDSEGYKFYISFESIRSNNPLRFSPSNPYVIHNIDNYTITNREGYIFKSTVYTKASDYNLEWICPHGHIFKTSWQVFQNNYQCVKCTKPNKNLTKEEFIELLPVEYELISDYVNASCNVLLRHSCGFKYPIQPSRLINKKPSCKKCKGLVKKDTESFKKEINELYNDEYEVLGEYVQSHVKLLIKHRLCGNEYEVTPTNLLSSKRCPLCSLKNKEKFDFESWLSQNLNDEYELLSPYINTDTRVKLKHKICQTEWSHTPYDIVHRNARCPICIRNKNNKSEKELGRYIKNLIEGTIYHIQFQYWFDDCRGKNKCPYYFDYAILDENDNIVLLIERHGEQHYEFIKFLHRDYQTYLDQKDRDNKKEYYCKINNIPLEIIKGEKVSRKSLEYQNVKEVLIKHKVLNN